MKDMQEFVKGTSIRELLEEINLQEEVLCECNEHIKCIQYKIEDIKYDGSFFNNIFIGYNKKHGEYEIELMYVVNNDVKDSLLLDGISNDDKSIELKIVKQMLK